MSDQIATGALSGINLAGDDEAPEATLPPEDERTDAPETPVEAPEAPEVPETADEPQDEPQAPEAAPAPAEETAAAAPVKKPGAPARQYVILKEEKMDDGSSYYVQPTRDGEPLQVESRNAQNAMRQAFKELSAEDSDAAEATLVVIPKTMFRPTAVRLARTERVSVQFG